MNDMPKTVLCCGKKPRRECVSLSYGSSNDVWRLICRVCKRYDKDFKHCYTELEAVKRWNMGCNLGVVHIPESQAGHLDFP